MMSFRPFRLSDKVNFQSVLVILKTNSKGGRGGSKLSVPADMSIRQW